MRAKLENLIYNDHVAGCGSSQCDITASYESGQTLWSAHLLLSAGAASNELDALYRQMKPSKRKLDLECAEFIKSVPYTKCPHCDSVNWNTDSKYLPIFCWQCARNYGNEE